MKMKKYNSLPVDVLRELIDYNPDTGTLTWKERSAKYIPSGSLRIAKTWNTRFAGTLGLKTKHIAGYLCGIIFSKQYLAHRVAFAIYYGRWPNDEIDHIDHNRENNKIANLREATRGENCKNVSQQKNNTTGYTGVRWRNDIRKYAAFISSNGNYFYLGIFNDINLAVAVREKAERKLGFHINHGKREVPLCV